MSIYQCINDSTTAQYVQPRRFELQWGLVSIHQRNLTRRWDIDQSIPRWRSTRWCYSDKSAARGFCYFPCRQGVVRSRGPDLKMRYRSTARTPPCFMLCTCWHRPPMQTSTKGRSVGSDISVELGRLALLNAKYIYIFCIFWFKV